MISFLKTTLIGGVVLLIPFGILILLLDEVVSFLTWVATPLASQFPETDYFAIGLSTIIAWVLLVILCFIAGLAARSSVVSGFSSKTDKFLAGVIPGYGMIRVRIAAALDDEDIAAPRRVVTVEIGGLRRWAVVVNEDPSEGQALIYLPNTPNTDSGTVGVVSIDELTEVDIPAHQLLRALGFYGQHLPMGSTEETVKQDAPPDQKGE